MECRFHGMQVSWDARSRGMRGLVGCAVPCAKISCAELPATARTHPGKPGPSGETGPIRGNRAYPGKPGLSGETGPIRGNRAHPSMRMSRVLPRECGGPCAAERLAARRQRARRNISLALSGMPKASPGLGCCVGLTGVPNRRKIVPSSHVRV